MGKININDINIYYELHGKGTPIIFNSRFMCESYFLVWHFECVSDKIIKFSYSIIAGLVKQTAPMHPTLLK